MLGTFYFDDVYLCMSRDGNKAFADVRKKREKKVMLKIDKWARGRWPTWNPQFKALELLGQGKKIVRTTVKHNRLLLRFCLGKPLLLICLPWRSIYCLWRAIGDSYGTGDNFNVMLSTRRQLCGHVPQNSEFFYVALSSLAWGWRWEKEECCRANGFFADPHEPSWSFISTKRVINSSTLSYCNLISSVNT